MGSSIYRIGAQNLQPSWRGDVNGGGFVSLIRYTARAAQQAHASFYT